MSKRGFTGAQTIMAEEAFGFVGSIDGEKRRFAAPDGQLYKRIDSAEAKELGEWYLLLDDLAESRAAIDQYYDRFIDVAKNSPDWPIRIALFRDAFIQFAGCFKGGVKLDASKVYNGVANWEQAYQWARDIRDASAAHNFGPHRQHDVLAAMEWNEARDRVRFVGLGDVALRFGGPSKEQRSTILQLIELAKSAVQREIDRLKILVSANIRAVGPDQLLGFPDYEPRVPQVTEVRVNRDRFRKEFDTKTR